MISLVNNIIDEKDIAALCKWLQTMPRLTKGKLTKKFEEQFAEWLGVDYAVFCNSGSSANLLMMSVIKKELRNKRIVVPAICWNTTVSPAIQLGLEPILCEVTSNFTIDPDYFEHLCRYLSPSLLITVSALGFSPDYDRIIEICDEYDVELIEDNCECLGTSYKGTLLGRFGAMSSFSAYFGHAFSTIEGGIVVTNYTDVYHELLMQRSHGWSRDLPESKRHMLKEMNNTDDFNDIYTFYSPGYNLRSTDLQAFIGLRQIKKFKKITNTRRNNYELYKRFIKNDEWKIEENGDFIPSFGYPVIHSKRDKLVKALKGKVECRPLICGNMGLQPYWVKKYGKQSFPIADKIHKYGMYLPNHLGLTDKDIEYIAKLVNGVIS